MRGRGVVRHLDPTTRRKSQLPQHGVNKERRCRGSPFNKKQEQALREIGGPRLCTVRARLPIEVATNISKSICLSDCSIVRDHSISAVWLQITSSANPNPLMKVALAASGAVEEQEEPWGVGKARRLVTSLHSSCDSSTSESSSFGSASVSPEGQSAEISPQRHEEKCGRNHCGEEESSRNHQEEAIFTTAESSDRDHCHRDGSREREVLITSSIAGRNTGTKPEPEPPVGATASAGAIPVQQRQEQQRVVPRFSPAARLSGTCPAAKGLSSDGAAGGGDSRSHVTAGRGTASPAQESRTQVQAQTQPQPGGSDSANVKVVRPCPAKASVAFATDPPPAAPRQKSQQPQTTRPPPPLQPAALTDQTRQQRRVQQLQQHQHQQAQQLQLQQVQQQQAADKLAKERQEKERAAQRRQKEEQCAFPVPVQTARRGGATNMGSRQTNNGTGGHVHMSNGSKGGQPPPAGGAVAPSAPAFRHTTAAAVAGGGGKMTRAARGNSSSAAAAVSAPVGGRPSEAEAAAAAAPPTLLFERLVSEEVQELKAYARIIESQNRRLAELEAVHEDLEARLEKQTNERIELETTLETREKEWAVRCDALESERDQWKKTVEDERVKNERLLDLVYRKDKEIHRMIQRKYDSAKNLQQHGGFGHTHSHRSDHSSKRNVSSDKHNEKHSSDHSLAPDRHKSPHEILAQSGNVEAVRERNVTNSLLDFFGM